MKTKTSDLEIVELYKSGLSSRKIANQTGISNTQVCRILKRNNVKKRSLKTDSEIEKKIIERYLAKESSEVIAKDFGLNGSTICRILKRHGIEIRSAEENKRKYEINADFFETIDSEAKAYFLGFLYADGNISKNSGHICINIHEKDEDLILNFGNLLYKNKDYCVTKYKKYLSISLYSKRMKNDLVKLGCTPKKSFTLRLPKLPDHLMHHFIRGVFDGDGCFYISENKSIKPTISLIGSKDFLNDIQKYLFDKIGITGSFSSSKKSKKIYNIYYSKKIYLTKLINYLYKDATLFLRRKREKADQIVKLGGEKNAKYYSTTNIVKYKGNRLSANYIKLLNDEDKKEAADFVFDYFRANGFPFPKYSSDDLIKEFNTLKQYKIQDKCPKSLVGQKIIHHFCEHFFKVYGNRMLSLFDAFHDDDRLKSTIHNRMGISYKETFTITGNMIRQGLRNSYNAFAVSFFKPIVARYIYNNFAPKNASVLDISAGFGQRMLGACASQNIKNYTGLDPWVENFQCLNEIKDFFSFDNVTLYNIGSEHFKTDKKYDFCFSSPPFFNKEVYSSEETQAYQNRTFDEFLSDWWVPTVKNVHRLLKKDSLFVLNMDKKMADAMINETSYLFKQIDIFSLNYSRSHLKKEGKERFFILKRLDV